MPARLLTETPIVITGRGVLSAAGASADELWQTACTGKSPAIWMPWKNHAGGSFAGCVVKEIPNVSRLARKMDRAARLALVAAQAAWREAGLEGHSLNHERLGAIAATSRGPVEKWRESFERAGSQLPTLAAHTTVASLSGVLSLHFQFAGPCLTVSATCASSAAAIVLAAQHLLTGEADIMLAGGAEAPLCPTVLEQFEAARLLGTHESPGMTCRPFDASRNGTVLGEGAGFLVLETLASARQRNAPVWGSLAGWCVGSEGHARAGMDVSGASMARIMSQALIRADLAPAEIGCVNLHGTGTRLNDLSEAHAVQRVFGAVADQPGCSSTKPITGHCMGAGAAIEAIMSLEALRHQALPPSANCEEPDPECAINLVRGKPRPAVFRAAMSTSAGFWGNQAALVFTRE